MQKFVIEQKVTLLANQYRIYHADDSGAKQEQIGFAHQKRFSFRERFEVYTDEKKSKVLFTVQARSVVDLGARYDVRDADGQLVGVLGKTFKTSLLRSTWQIFSAHDEDQSIARAQERSKTIAILRRLWQFVPEIGDFPFIIRYHFEFLDANGQAVGSFNKTTRLHDNYLLSADEVFAQKADWRTLIALGIMLDALQGR